MNRFVVALTFVACAYGAPAPDASVVAGHFAPAAPAVVQQHTEYGVVGHQTVQVGTQKVQSGHQYVQVGQEVIPQPAHPYAAGVATDSVHTVPLPAPAIPAPPR